MNARRTFAVLAAGLLAVTLAACGSGDDKSATSTGDAVSRADREKARDAARKAAGLPPEPSTTARYAYLEALDVIDPRISKPGMDEQSMSRGMNQCGSIKTTKDRARLVKLTLERFTIATRLPDINNEATGAKILDTVHTYLCPDF
ncbi:hypothetical protein [Streptomyces sp. NBC_00236]|uniref:hypothetical protein n=1 Tax=Streptomyces sp. NBC_00236 TaxID=2903639 RepID=UPI002E2D4E00|nr:hypothetical protein [Streptomyces sp. NBC_00236]